MASTTYNVGVIGYGMSAKTFHIPFILVVQSLKFYAIVQRNPTVDDNAATDYPGIKSYRTTEELVKDPAVDVVVITTVPESHFALTKLALEAGKHVICEKPFVPTAAEADELIVIAKKYCCLLSVFQNRRWDTDFLTVSHLIKSNTLGRVIEFESHYDRWDPTVPSSWKGAQQAGGGAIYSLGTHLLDQAVELFGMPKRITGFITPQRIPNPSGFEDSFTCLLHYDAILATIKAAAVSAELRQLRFWIRGDKGSFKKFHVDIQSTQIRDGMKPGDKGFALEPEERFGILTIMDGNSPTSSVFPNTEPGTYTIFYTRFAEALSGQGEVPVKAEDARDVLGLVELALESSRTGRTLDV